VAHELAEKTAGLASRVDNLAALETGDTSRELERQQVRLEKLALVAIAEDLDASAGSYQAAIASLTAAIAAVGEADRSMKEIGKIIELVSKTADLVEAALKAAA
jgi:phage host-nuclease inhibitor protein Gam